MALITQSGAYTRSFLMVGTADHITGQAAAAPKLNISKAGGALSSTNAVIAELGVGLYTVALTSTDTNTIGDLLLHFTGTSADPSDFTDQVVAVLPANVTQWNGTAVAAPATAGIPDVNVKNYNNQTAQTDANNLPKVDVEDVKGVASLGAAGYLAPDWANLTGTSATKLLNNTTLGSVNTVVNPVTSGTVIDKTGYSLAQAFPSNFAALAITAGGAVTVGTNNDKSGYSLNSSQTTVTIGAVNTVNGLSVAALANFLNLSVGSSAVTAQSVVAGIWDTKLSDHLSSGSTGLALNSAGSAGDPWSTAIPGAYAAGTAGNIVGNNLNATITSRMSSAQTVVVGTNNDKTGYSLNSSQTNVTVGFVNTVTNPVTSGTVIDKAGYSLAQAFPSNFAALAITGGGAVTVGTNNDKSGYSLNSSQTAVTIGAVNTLTNPVTSGTVLDKTLYQLTPQQVGAIVSSGQTTLMGESYAAKGAAPSLAQALFEMRSHLTEKSINQTSISLFQVDGATIWGAGTLDSTTPTTVHRGA